MIANVISLKEFANLLYLSIIQNFVLLTILSRLGAEEFWGENKMVEYHVI